MRTAGLVVFVMDMTVNPCILYLIRGKAGMQTIGYRSLSRSFKGAIGKNGLLRVGTPTGSRTPLFRMKT